MSIANRKDLVVSARAKYGDLAGRERAHRIINQVAWDLRHDGAGLFFKTGPNSFADRSSDIVIFKTDDPTNPVGKGPTFDVLGDAEGKATPAWGRTAPTGFGDIAKWRAPVDPATLGPSPEPEPVPQPEPTPAPVPQPPTIPAPDGNAAIIAALRELSDRFAAVERRVAALELARYQVRGTTERVYGHAHGVSLTVERV